MNKTKLIFLMLASVLLMSCGNGLLPVIDDGSDWTSTLEDIVTSNKQLFSYRGLEIVGSRKLTGVKVNGDLFYNGEYSSFPVYSPKDSCYKVVSYSDLRAHSDEYGYDMCRVDSTIESILSHSDDYDVIRLDWQGQSDNYQSLALFDKRTGELEYDNMLFNMSMARNYNTNEFSVLLSQFEVIPVATGGDYVSYERNGIILANAGIRWDVYAEGSIRMVKVSEDADNEIYVVMHDNRYDHMTIGDVSFNSDPSLYRTYVCYHNRSVSNEPRFWIDYGLWAGPLEYNNESPEINAAMTNSEFLNFFSEGTGKVVHYMESLYRFDDVIYIPKNQY